MKTSDDTKRDARALLATWAALIALTMGSFWLADSHAVAAGATAGVLGFGVVKGLLIASVFMEMRRGPLAWLVVMWGFLIVEGLLLYVVSP